MNKVSDEKRRVKRVIIRVSVADLAEIKKQAKSFNLTLSQYTRMKILGSK